MRKMTTDELFDLLRYDTAGKFYSVEFQRRTTRRDRLAVAGDMRRMLCKTAGGMSSYKLGMIPDEARDAEDLRCAVLTVWDVQAFMRNRNRGMDKDAAGLGAWRRIDLCTVVECSVVDPDELPPEIVAGMHEITNLFRLRNMPRIRR